MYHVLCYALCFKYFKTYNSAIKIIGKKEGELMTLNREAKTVWDMVDRENESRVHVIEMPITKSYTCESKSPWNC